MPDLTPEAQRAMDCFDALGYALRKALPLKGPPEPEPAKTPTKVAERKIDGAKYICIWDRRRKLFEASVHHAGAAVWVRFHCWPEIWRGKGHICKAGDWKLRSCQQPALGRWDGQLWGPGHTCDRDSLLAQMGYPDAGKAAEAYDGILALLNAAKALAEDTLTLETE